MDATQAAEERKFQNWMDALDRIVWANLGCTTGDLPDKPFRDGFDDGLTPEEFAEDHFAIGDGEVDFDALYDLLYG